MLRAVPASQANQDQPASLGTARTGEQRNISSHSCEDKDVGAGVTSVDFSDPLAATYPGAQFVVRVEVTHVFPNCPRYIHRMELVERSRFVPAADGSAPVPDWKRADWVQDVLPTGDAAREKRGVTEAPSPRAVPAAGD